jgi:hypothetical protein
MYQSCIDACNACAVECEHCASACLQEEEVKMMARCIGLDRDCARICFAAVGFMASGSEFAQEVCRVCAEVCRACGEECRRHDTEHCQRCAEACERCGMECSRMSYQHA